MWWLVKYNIKKIYNVYNIIHKEGGTGEALKLKLHLNSEINKREILMILG